MFANKVALKHTQVQYLNKVVRKIPTSPIYVCTINASNTKEQKAKMVNKITTQQVLMCASIVVSPLTVALIVLQYFSRKFTNSVIKRNLDLPTTVHVYCNKENCGKVRIIDGKGKGKGAQLTSGWPVVVEEGDMLVGDVFMFRFHESAKYGLLLLVDEVV